MENVFIIVIHELDRDVSTLLISTNLDLSLDHNLKLIFIEVSDQDLIILAGKPDRHAVFPTLSDGLPRRLDAIITMNRGEDLDVQSRGGLGEEPPGVKLGRVTDAVPDLINQEDSVFRVDQGEGDASQVAYAVA